MNKQTVIAGLVGAISAQDAVPCESPFVSRIEEHISELEIAKEGLEFNTEALTAAETSETTLFETADGRATDQATLMAPFLTALATAKTNYETQAAAVAAATSALTALDTPVAAATAAKDAAIALVADQQADIDAQQLIVDQLQQAVNDHATELASMQTLLDTATSEFDAATTAKSDAEAAKTTLETERDADPTGQATIQTATAADLSTKTGDYDTAVTEESTSFGTYQPAKLAYDKAAKECAMIDLGCTFQEAGPTDYTCVGQTNDPILGLKTACDAARDGSITTTKNDETTTWEAAVTKVATKWSLKTSSNADNVVALANLATINASIDTIAGTLDAGSDPVGSLIATLSTKTTAKGTAQTNWDTVNGQHTQAETDLGRGNTLLATLTAARTPLDDDVVVKKYLEGIQLDLQTAQEEAKTAANANLDDLEGLKDLAQATVDRAQITMNFYQGLLDTATDSKDAAAQDVTDNAALIAGIDADIEDAEAELAAAIAECKGQGYDMAQAALKALMDAEEGKRIAAADVKVDYEAKAAFATGGETNTLCAFPPKAKDAAQEPRPECSEGFCCGAAQKFLKDGTKLVLETCQKEVGVHTYLYYPPLPAGATVEPSPEIWRFQCISGAQKLVAAATAALAASYMMA